MTNNVTGVTGYVMGYVTGKNRAVIGLLRVLRGFVPARARECEINISIFYKYISHAHVNIPVTPVTPVTRLYTCAFRMLRGTHTPITPRHILYSL